MSIDPIRDIGLTGKELERVLHESEILRSAETARLLRGFGGWLKHLVTLGATDSKIQPQRHNTSSVIS